jgi:hypothetical protein
MNPVVMIAILIDNKPSIVIYTTLMELIMASIASHTGVTASTANHPLFRNSAVTHTHHLGLAEHHSDTIKV